MAQLDLNKIRTSVASISPNSASADVRLESTENGPEFVFAFKLPKGEDGKDGTSVLGLSLTNDVEWVPCLDDGTPDEDLGNEHASTRVLLMDGDKQITEGVQYYLNPGVISGDFSVSNGGDVSVKLTKESPDKIDLICGVIYRNNKYEKIFSIKKAIGTPVYKVIPDVSTIKQEDGKPVIPSELRVDVLKWNGKKWVLTSEKPVYYDFTLMSIDNHTGKSEFIGNIADQLEVDADTIVQSIPLHNYNNYKSLTVYIKDEFDVILDKQSLSIVKDGIGVISANAYVVLPTSWDISNYTVTGGTYYTINDSDTYNSLTTRDEFGDIQDIVWSPTNSNQREDTQAIWMISNVFASTDDQNVEQTWSSPIKLQDSDKFQVEYSNKETETMPNPTSLEDLILHLTTRSVDPYERVQLTSEVLEREWRIWEANPDIQEDPWEWSDTCENPKWMATCRLQNGKWTNWTITKCRGELGYSAMEVELSNDYEFIPCINDAAGNWIPDDDLYTLGDPIASTEIVLMNGTENVTKECIVTIESPSKTLSSEGFENLSEKDASDNVIWEFIADSTSNVGVLNVYSIGNNDINNFKITLMYTDPRTKLEVPHSATFKVIKAKNAVVYRLVPNCTVINVSEANRSKPERLEIGLQKWDGQKWIKFEQSAENKLVRYSCSGNARDNQDPVTVIPEDKILYENGNLVINTDSWITDYPGDFTFEVDIKTEDGQSIGMEKESIPVVVDGATGKEGNGIKERITKYYLSNSCTEHPNVSDENWFPKITDIDWKSDTNKGFDFMWCKETIVYTNGTSEDNYYVCGVRGEQGATGQTGGTGKEAPIIYSAGVWNGATEYKIEYNAEGVEIKVPYIYLLLDLENKQTAKEDRYWKLNVPSSKGVNPLTKDQTDWTPMPYFESIYSDAGAFNQALVGSFVFNGEHMYSQLGKNKNYDTASDPNDVNTWVPNAYINAKTGNAWFAQQRVKFNDNGEWRLGGDQTWINCDSGGNVTLHGITLTWDDITDNDRVAQTIVTNAQTGMVSDTNFATKFNTEFKTKKVVTDDNFNDKFDVRVADKSLIDSNTLNGKGYQTATEVQNYVKGLGYVTNTQLNDYLKTADINDKIQTYVANNKSAIASTIKNDLVNNLTKSDLTTKIGNTYIQTTTTITSQMIAGTLDAKTITGSTIVCDSPDISGDITIEDGNGILINANDFGVVFGAGCGNNSLWIQGGKPAKDWWRYCTNAAINISGVSSVGAWEWGINSDGKIKASGFYQSSDSRLKNFISDIDIDFEKLKQIPKSYFTWKDGHGSQEIGTSAQCLQTVYPELVFENKDGILNVDYAKLSIIALAAIDKLNDELNNIKSKLN